MKKKKESIPIRCTPEFKKMLENINIKRIKMGKSKRFLPPRRLTKAITRIPKIEDFLVENITNEKYE